MKRLYIRAISICRHASHSFPLLHTRNPEIPVDYAANTAPIPAQRVSTYPTINTMSYLVGKHSHLLALAALDFVPHHIQAPGEITLQADLAPQEPARLLQPLDIPSHHPRRLLLPRLAQPLPYDFDHGIVQAGVEVRARRLVGVVVPAVVAAVGVQVAAELDEELEGEGGAVGELGEVFDGGEECQECRCESGGGEVGGERVLEAVEIAV